MRLPKILLIAVLFVVGCSKDDDPEPEIRTQGFSIEVKKNERLSTGEIKAQSANISVIHVWKADNKNLSIKSTTDAIKGFAFDNSTSQSVKSEYTYFSSYAFENVDPGKYFVFVRLGNDPGVSFAYSYTNFELGAGSAAQLKKTFTTKAIPGSYEEWNKAE